MLIHFYNLINSNFAKVYNDGSYEIIPGKDDTSHNMISYNIKNEPKIEQYLISQNENFQYNYFCDDSGEFYYRVDEKFLITPSNIDFIAEYCISEINKIFNKDLLEQIALNSNISDNDINNIINPSNNYISFIQKHYKKLRESAKNKELYCAIKPR